MNHTTELCDRLNADGFKAAIWQDRRIYLNGCGKDIKAYIELDDPLRKRDPNDATDTLYSGCTLKVYSNAAQDRAWLVNRAKKVKHALMLRLVENGIVPGPVCPDWRAVIL